MSQTFTGRGRFASSMITENALSALGACRSSPKLPRTLPHNGAMADTGLFALYKLHLVDSSLYEMKQHAAALDVGRAEAAKVRELEADPEGLLTHARQLSAELKDLELQQKGFEDKVKKLDADLFSGKITNPREIAAIEKDKGLVNEQRAKVDARILELWELVPPAKEAAAEIEASISALKETIAKKQVAARAEHEHLQASYKAKAAERAPAAAKVPKPLLDVYEKLRAKLDVGMALVTNDNRCESCGMLVPTKALEHIREDKVTQCEQCRRILFKLQQG